MITIRWTSFAVAVVTMIAAAQIQVSLTTLVLAVIFLAAFITHCWTLGAFHGFRRWLRTRLRVLASKWVVTMPANHPDTIRSLARRDRVASQHQENRP